MNRRPSIAFAIVLGLFVTVSTLWLLSACKSQPPTETPSEIAATPSPDLPAFRDAQIIVRDAETSQPVKNANVQVGESHGPTDATGMYVVSVAQGSTQPTEVRLPGYKEWRGQVVATTPDAAPIVLDVSLEPNAVKGQVVGHEGAPLPDARIAFGDHPVPVDDAGQFTLRRVKQGDRLVIERPGYVQGQAVYDGQSTLRVALEPISASVGVRDAWTGLQVANASVCAEDDVCWPTNDTGQAVVQPFVRSAPLTVQRSGYLTHNVALHKQEAFQVALAPRELVGVIRDAQSGQPLTNTTLFVNGQIVPLESGARYHLPDLTTVYTLFVKSPGYKRVTIPIDAATKTSQHDVLDACQDPDGQGRPCVDINLPRFAVRGVYANFGLLTWDNAKLFEIIDMVERSPILNAIVIDVKTDRGWLAFESSDPLIADVEASLTPRLALSEFLDICREKHIYAIARIVVFKDSPLVEARPELAVRHPNGAIFYDREDQAWADPTRKEVWDYNIAITKEVIRLGFDEVQYDYLRYPSDSTSLAVVRALVYSIPSTLESRTAAISGFVIEAKKVVDQTPAFLSADIFGYSLSVTPEHDMRIGQRLMDLAPHVDYVCPMVYPSTFIPGNLGLASPSDSPYEVIARSMAYGLSRTGTIMRPWLQGYWYERQDFADQRRAAEEATDTGWCFWNARGNYDELFFIPPEGIEP